MKGLNSGVAVAALISLSAVSSATAHSQRDRAGESTAVENLCSCLGSSLHGSPIDGHLYCRRPAAKAITAREFLNARTGIGHRGTFE